MIELLEYLIVLFFLTPTFFAFYLAWQDMIEENDDLGLGK